MLATAIIYARTRPVRTGLLIMLVIAALLAVAQVVAYTRFLGFSRDLDRAMSAEPSGEAVEVSWSFPCRRGRTMVTVPVFESEIAAGRALDTRHVFSSSGWLREAYVTRLVTAYAHSPLAERLLERLRAIRSARGLNSDEYLEFVVSAVQAIPYGVPDAEVAFPAEVLTGGTGVCSDKSLLLAGLLLAEGYDTVVWIFPTQWHTAVGVASDGAVFLDSGYAFIETTSPAFVGQVAQPLQARGPVAAPPQEIRVGGRLRYEAGAEVEFILGELRSARTSAAGAARYALYARTDEKHRGRYAERMTESWVAEGRARYILTNTHDRPAVYRVLARTAGDRS
jgi:hypothetical protein